MPTNARDAIQQVNDEFVDCVRQKNSDGIAALYSSDAVLLPPNHEFVEGGTAIRDFWETMIGTGVTRATLDTVELHAFGDMAMEIGKYTISAGEPVVDHGKYVVLWKKEQGQWRLFRDMWNSSAEAANVNAA